jgi:2-(1,2-epoxy-1,2-dihydrophenyl)acetyl-CoA isomerase
MGRAFEYAATGRDIGAEEAERVGLVNRVVPSDGIEAATMELAQMLAGGPTRTYGLIKRTLNKALSSNLEELLEYEAMVQQIASESDDHREGVQAFLEKRPPRFMGG